MRDDTKGTALIAGAGVGGLVSAIALRRKGFQVKIFEARDKAAARDDGTALNIWSNATTALDMLGLKHAVTEAGLPIESNVICSATGTRLLRSDTRALVDMIGTASVSVLRRRLMEVLHAALDGVEVHYNESCVGYRNEGDQVVLELRRGEARGDVLVAADGVRSRLRDQMSGEGGPRYLGQTVWRGLAPVSPALEPKTLYLVWGDAVVGGCYGVGEGQACWFVGAHRPQGEKDPPERLTAILKGMLSGIEGPLPATVSGTNPATIIKTDLFERPLPKLWRDGRVVLLGDAAHAMPTALGQGACQAIEDAVVLGECLTSGEVERGLTVYQERRLPRVRWVRSKVHRIWQFQEYTSPVMCGIRNVVVRLIPERGSQKMWRQLLTFSA